MFRDMAEFHLAVPPHDFNVYDSVSNRFVGPTHTDCIPENVESLRYAVLMSPLRSQSDLRICCASQVET